MLRFLTQLPFRYHWCMVLLMGFIIPALTAKTEKPGEFYPFSNFPMYSRFEPQTYYVYLRTLKGDVMPVSPLFGTSISNVKKVYDRKLTALKKTSTKSVKKADLPPEAKQEAAREVLQWLVSIAPKDKLEQLNALGGMELHQVDIEYRDGKIAKKDATVGTLNLTSPTTKP